MAIGGSLAVVWLFVRGIDPYDTSPLQIHVAEIVGELLIGLSVGLTIAFLLRGMYARRLPLTGVDWILRFYYGSVYVGILSVEIVKSNIDVASRVLRPTLPIAPKIIEVPLRVDSDLAITIIANSITLTPGTLTMDYVPEQNTLYVHSIGGPPEDLLTTVRRWEEILIAGFDS
jgi:multicomponent Na+:H+ antiporter subunit E